MVTTEEPETTTAVEEISTTEEAEDDICAKLATDFEGEQVQIQQCRNGKAMVRITTLISYRVNWQNAHPVPVWATAAIRNDKASEIKPTHWILITYFLGHGAQNVQFETIFGSSDELFSF